MIPPVEMAVQRMMNSLSKPGKASISDIHLQCFRYPFIPRGMQDIKTPIQTIVMQFLSHSVMICKGVTRDGNPYPF